MVRAATAEFLRVLLMEAASPGHSAGGAFRKPLIEGYNIVATVSAGFFGSLSSRWQIELELARPTKLTLGAPIPWVRPIDTVGGAHRYRGCDPNLGVGAPLPYRRSDRNIVMANPGSRRFPYDQKTTKRVN